MKASEVQRLVDAARAARKNAYAPYSGYRVGASVLTAGGGLYAGSNVENATYGATLCAERSAIAAMIAVGERHPIACAVVASGPRPAAPCGICRQVLAEFAIGMPLFLIAEDEDGKVVRRTRLSLRTLLPHAFRFRPPKAASG
ncbi:MAG: cytidine deaminase [Polyangiaceae bacterium]